jgi:hypothetical protein
MASSQLKTPVAIESRHKQYKAGFFKTLAKTMQKNRG